MGFISYTGLTFCAGQVLADMKWTRASDVYSFGVVVFEVFSQGGFPFQLVNDESLPKLFSDESVAMSDVLFSAPLPSFSSTLFAGCYFYFILF